MSTRYNTGNPIESTDVRDMSDNAKNLDLFSNSSDMAFDDRFGVERKTIHGMNSEFNSHILNMGFARIGTFASGATLTNPRQTLLWDIAGGGDGWLSTINGLAGQLRFQAAENWTNQTSGTSMILALSPLAATTGVAGLTANALNMSLSNTIFQSNGYIFQPSPVNALTGDGSLSFTISNNRVTSGTQQPVINFVTQRSAAGSAPFSPTIVGELIKPPDAFLPTLLPNKSPVILPAEPPVVAVKELHIIENNADAFALISM